VRLSAVAANRLFAQIADFDVRRAEMAQTFGARLGRLARTAGVRALHEAMLTPAVKIVHTEFAARRTTKRT